MHDLVLTLWERHRPAVLMVTHDVDEALALADRVLVLRGGRIAYESPVSAARPTRPRRPCLVDLRNQLLAELGVEEERNNMNDQQSPYWQSQNWQSQCWQAQHRASPPSPFSPDQPQTHELTAAASIALAVATAVAGVPSATAAPRRPSAARSPDLSQVTLRFGDQAGTGAEALLKAAGLFWRSCLSKPTWSDFSSGPPMLQAMGAGAIDIGGVGDAPPVFAAAGGAKIAIVGATENGANSAALVVPKGSPITSISQLRGKTIAVAQGSSADYHLLTVLDKGGLDCPRRDPRLPSARRRPGRPRVRAGLTRGTSGLRTSKRSCTSTAPGSW